MRNSKHVYKQEDGKKRRFENYCPGRIPNFTLNQKCLLAEVATELEHMRRKADIN